MVLTLPLLAAIIALLFGILILIMPRLLNFIVAVYLIIIGVLGILAAFTWTEEAVNARLGRRRKQQEMKMLKNPILRFWLVIIVAIAAVTLVLIVME
jgi:uncharacterized membrane protein